MKLDGFTIKFTDTCAIQRPNRTYMTVVTKLICNKKVQTRQLQSRLLYN